MKTQIIKRLLVGAVVVLLLGPVGRASAFTAKPGGGDWNNANTWVEGTVPSASDDANIGPNVQVGAPTSINNLTISGSGTFFNSGTLTVGGDLTLSSSAKVQQGAVINITGALNIGAGTQYDPSCNAMSVGGNTTIDGILKDGCGGNLVNALGGDVTVDSGGQWQLTDVTEWQVGGNLANNGTITATSGGITFTGSGKTITGGATPIPKLTVNGSVANNTTLTVSGALAGSGALTQGASSSLTLGGTATIGSLDAATNPNTVTYNGNNQTILGTTYQQLVLAGTATKTFANDTIADNALEIPSPLRANVNASLTAPSITVDSGATLGGTGTLVGPVTVNGTLSPALTTGTQIGTLSFSAAPGLNNITTEDINRTGSPNADVVSVSGTITYANTLTVVNRGGALTDGDSFQLFSASGYTGSFATLNLPALGANLAWNNTLAANGTIAVISTASPGAPKLSISISGGTLNMLWDTNTFPGYSLQSQSSAAGIAAGTWGAVSGGDVSPYQTSITAADAPTFYRLIK